MTAFKTLGLCVSQPILWRATDHEDNHENGGTLGWGLTEAIRQPDPNTPKAVDTRPEAARLRIETLGANGYES
jgi:hypothetical protein